MIGLPAFEGIDRWQKCPPLIFRYFGWSCALSGQSQVFPLGSLQLLLYLHVRTRGNVLVSSKCHYSNIYVYGVYVWKMIALFENIQLLAVFYQCVLPIYEFDNLYRMSRNTVTRVAPPGVVFSGHG